MWKRFGHLMGEIVARVVLTIFYFTIFVPFGLGVRLLGDLLEIGLGQTRWSDRKTRDLEMNNARRLS